MIQTHNRKIQIKGLSKRELKRSLSDETAFLRKAIAQQEETLRTPGSTRGDNSDEATELVEQSTSLAVIRQLKHLLAQIESAYQRVENGTYGICASCHEPIPLERLEALPYAALCVKCQAGHKIH